MSFIPAFQLNLNEKIQRGQATIGRYDGKHPTLTCATTAGKVFLHNPHQEGLGSDQITYLNINKTITAVVAGNLVDSVGRDVLLIGTPTNLQCYDVNKNRDVFFKDIPDGVNTVLVGPCNTTTALAIVGGNCSVQAFDHDGGEKFWTVTGDNVTAMAMCDVNGDSRPELLVGSDDFDLRVFQGEEMVAETSEADQFVGLCSITSTHFGYGLVNGTIGVYERLERAWRVKSKHSVCTICSYDLDGDGVPELVSGWSNGRIEVRREDSGEVVYRDHLSASVSHLLVADYRNDGQEQVIVCGMEGEIRGYLPNDPAVPSALPMDADFSVQQALIAELSQRKQELQYELSSYQNTHTLDRTQVDQANIIPSDTRVDSFVAVNKDTATCDLVLRTNNDSVIRGVVVFGEQIFVEESLFVFPRTADTSVAIPLKPVKDVSVILMIKVLVGTRTSTVHHIFDLEIELPKFSMYSPVEKGQYPEPTSFVQFTVNERVPRLANWIETRFSVKAIVPRADILEAFFVCLRDKMPLVINVAPVNNSVQVTFKTDNMEMAGELVCDLAGHLGIADLASIAEFPVAMAQFKAVQQKVEDFNATRLRMNADMADSSNLVKQLLIKAEDVRIMGNMAVMKYYRQLYDLNRDLINEHDKRATNHTELLSALKEVNQMIQRAARLRVGGPKTRVVTACRAAVKSNNTALLFKIIRDGDGPT